MSTSVRRLGKLSLRLAIYSALLLLGFLNAQVILFDQNPSEASLFGFHLSFTLPQAVALKQQAAGDGETTGGGGNTGWNFVARQTDVWHCYALGTLMNIGTGGTNMAAPCYRELGAVSVQTEVCEQSGTAIMCTPGTWRWSPNPPCGSAYTTPPAFMPC